MRLLLAGLSFFFFFSCGERVPDGVIPKKQMPDVLVDVHLADGQLSSLPIDSARAHIDSYYQAIFDRYGIDSVQLANSIAYYAHRPHIMNELYGIVEKRLEALNIEQQQAVDQKYQLQRSADSIANARRRDSIARLTYDSLDMARKKHLLFLPSADSSYSDPVPVTHEQLKRRLWEQLRLRGPNITNDEETGEVTSVNN